MHLMKYAAVAGALAAPAAFMAPASASSGGSGSAFGVGADGLVSIPHTPAVSSAVPPGDRSLVALPANPLVSLKVLHVTAHPGHARASVVDLAVPKAELSAHLVTAECKNGVGSSRLVDASIAGHRLAVVAAPNSRVSVPVQGLGTVSVVLNKQVRGPGGLTVTAIQVNLPPVLGKPETISVSSATCRGGSGGPTNPSPSPKPTPPGEAPAPSPVPSNLPVTG